MTHWYTADLHLGHENIIPFSGRLFRHADHMDSVLIEKLWERVGPDDDLWIVGDFAAGAKATDQGWLTMIFSHLPGARRHLVHGNHDGPIVRGLPWDSVAPMCEVDDPAVEFPVTLCHYPMMTWPNARKGALHLFGHVHGSWLGCARSVNVGVDVWDFCPTTAKEATNRAATLPPHQHWSDVEPGS